VIPPLLADDFGSTFPAWAQLSAVAILVAGMGVALRIMWKLLKESIDRERARADKAEADYDKLSREFIDRLIPAGASSQQLLAAMAEELRRATDEIRGLRDRDRDRRR
jgi:hypothetical protein